MVHIQPFDDSKRAANHRLPFFARSRRRWASVVIRVRVYRTVLHNEVQRQSCLEAEPCGSGPPHLVYNIHTHTHARARDPIEVCNIHRRAFRDKGPRTPSRRIHRVHDVAYNEVWTQASGSSEIGAAVARPPGESPKLLQPTSRPLQMELRCHPWQHPFLHSNRPAWQRMHLRFAAWHSYQRCIWDCSKIRGPNKDRK